MVPKPVAADELLQGYPVIPFGFGWIHYCRLSSGLLGNQNEKELPAQQTSSWFPFQSCRTNMKSIDKPITR